MDTNEKHLSQMDNFLRLIEETRKAYQAFQMPYSKFIEDMERNRWAIENMLRPWKDFQELLSQVSISPAILSFSQTVKDIQNQWNSIDHLFKEPILRIDRMVEEWRKPIQLLQNDVSMIISLYSKEFESLRNLALSPSINYGMFIKSAATELELPRTHKATRIALQASIESAGFEINAENRLISQYPKSLSLDLTEPFGEDFSPPFMNLFWIQRDDLFLMVRQNPKVVRNENLLLNLPSSRYAFLARTICQEVVEINSIGAVRGYQQIFKITNRVAEALFSIPMLLAIDRNTFGEFLDHLYFIFYEAAGRDTLRILDFIDEGEAQPVWDIKHLRNYLYRHDIEHGNERAIHKKQQTLSQLFQRLIGKSYPRSREDFRIMQVKLADDVLKMLKIILKKIGP